GSVFWINVPLAAVAVAGVLRFVPEPDYGRMTTRRFDLVGAVLSAAGLVTLVDAVIEAPARGWTGAVTVGEAAASVALLTAFVLFELRSPEPMIDVRIFAHRAFSAASGAISLT